MYKNTNEEIVKLAKTYLQLSSSRNYLTITVAASAFEPGTNFLQWGIESSSVNLSKFNGHFDHPAITFKQHTDADICVVKRWNQFSLLENILPYCERIALIESYVSAMTAELQVVRSLYSGDPVVESLVQAQQEYLNQSLKQVSLEYNYQMCAEHVAKSTP